MKQSLVILITILIVSGILLFSCDMEPPTQVSAPDTETLAAAKPALPDVALEKIIAVQNKHTNALLGIEGVVGTAATIAPDGRGAILVMTKTPGIAGIPHLLDGIPVIAKACGVIKALPKPPSPPGQDKPGDEDPVEPIDPTARFSRPVPIGVSTGHPMITAGTIGCRVTDGAGKVFALSNNHVYADENRAALGSGVIQPGAYDGGTSPADDIGILSAYEPIVFSTTANNIMDAALALCTPETLGNATPSDGYGIPKSTTIAPKVNLKVVKYGRTTGQTNGKIFAINATVNVEYETGIARYVEQLVIIPGTFSAGGDSGSLIISDDRKSKEQPVGLLFAGSSTVTIASPIDPILVRFGVTIDGE